MQQIKKLNRNKQGLCNTKKKPSAKGEPNDTNQQNNTKN